MTESKWLNENHGMRMFALVRDRLSHRKQALIGCELARELLPLVRNPIYERLIDAVAKFEGRPVTGETAELWAEINSREFVRSIINDDGSWQQMRHAHRWLLGLLERCDPTDKLNTIAPVLREQLGNPYRPYRCEPEWRTETVIALASAIEAEHGFDRMPILADALEEAGCDEQPMLDHLRGPGPHARGCWVLDLTLNREPELFALPPLVPTPRRMKLGPFTPPPEGMA